MVVQGHAALIVSIISLTITLTLLAVGLRHEKKRPRDPHDDH